MGFEAGFTFYPKFKDYSFNDIKTVISYIKYFENKWYAENNISFNDYIKEDTYDVNFKVVDREDFNEACEFYKEFHEFDASINFCSEFRSTNDEIVELLGISADKVYHELTAENILDILGLVDDKIEDLPIYTIRRAYKYDEDDKDTFKSFPIDGVELTNSHGYTRTDVNCDCEPSFIIADDGGYVYDMNVRLYHTLCALTCIDLRNNIIVYYRSW